MDGPTRGLVARYPDGEGAGRAIERLSRRGIDAGRISLVGGTRVPDRATQRATDAGIAARIAGRLGRGVVLGAAVGAVFGAVVLLVVTSADPLLAGVIGAVAGGSAGGGLGALAGLQANPTMSAAWESTFSASGPDGVVLAVEGRDEDDLDEVERALGGTGAIEIRRAHDLEAVGRELRDDDPR